MGPDMARVLSDIPPKRRDIIAVGHPPRNRLAKEVRADGRKAWLVALSLAMMTFSIPVPTPMIFGRPRSTPVRWSSSSARRMIPTRNTGSPPPSS